MRNATWEWADLGKIALGAAATYVVTQFRDYFANRQKRFAATRSLLVAAEPVLVQLDVQARAAHDVCSKSFHEIKDHFAANPILVRADDMKRLDAAVKDATGLNHDCMTRWVAAVRTTVAAAEQLDQLRTLTRLGDDNAQATAITYADHLTDCVAEIEEALRATLPFAPRDSRGVISRLISDRGQRNGSL